MRESIILNVFVIVCLALSPQLCNADPPPDCKAGTDRHWAHDVLRWGSNDVWAFSSAWAEGTYEDEWTSTVSTTERLNGDVLYGRLNVQDSGTGFAGALLSWHDPPSSAGVGTYSLSGTISISSTCGDEDSANPYETLLVRKPEISGVLNLWYFNAASHAPIPTSGGYYYYQKATLVFNNMCLPGDKCATSAQWSHTTSGGQTYMSSTSGSSVTLYAGAAGNCQYDTAISASIGGFSSDSYAVAVNSPKFLVGQPGDFTQSWGVTGYLSRVNWSVADACSPANALTTVPLHEQFSGFSNPGVVSGWPDPTATSAPNFQSTYTWYDSIGATGYSNVPVPVFTSANPPFTFDTVIKTGGQSWWMGSEVAGQGIGVFNGTIRFYQDHGTSQ